MKFKNFRIFFRFFGAITVKIDYFSVQTVEFIFKWSNFNSNEPIMSRRVTTTRAALAACGSAAGTARPGQV
jgi:hypothetical protein